MCGRVHLRAHRASRHACPPTPRLPTQRLPTPRLPAIHRVIPDADRAVSPTCSAEAATRHRQGEPALLSSLAQTLSPPATTAITLPPSRPLAPMPRSSPWRIRFAPLRPESPQVWPDCRLHVASSGLGPRTCLVPRASCLVPRAQCLSCLVHLQPLVPLWPPASSLLHIRPRCPSRGP